MVVTQLIFVNFLLRDLMSAVNNGDDTVRKKNFALILLLHFRSQLIDAIVKSSVETGRFSIDEVDRDGWTVMHVAASQGQMRSQRPTLNLDYSLHFIHE